MKSIARWWVPNSLYPFVWMCYIIQGRSWFGQNHAVLVVLCGVLWSGRIVFVTFIRPDGFFTKNRKRMWTNNCLIDILFNYEN